MAIWVILSFSRQITTGNPKASFASFHSLRCWKLMCGILMALTTLVIFLYQLSALWLIRNACYILRSTLASNNSIVPFRVSTSFMKTVIIIMRLVMIWLLSIRRSSLVSVTLIPASTLSDTHKEARSKLIRRLGFRALRLGTWFRGSRVRKILKSISCILVMF